MGSLICGPGGEGSSYCSSFKKSSSIYARTYSYTLYPMSKRTGGAEHITGRLLVGGGVYTFLGYSSSTSSITAYHQAMTLTSHVLTFPPFCTFL